jgi:RNA polymerase sigma-70 factor (ECF subfamily)
MNKNIFLTIAALSLGVCLTGRAQTAATATVDSVAPVVIKTVPEAGAKEVTAGVVELKVTFSKEMADGSWSWSDAWKGSSPEVVGKPHYEADGKTCVIKVKLEPGKTYGYWINSQSFKNFKDRQGRSAVPYLFVFQTKG